MTCDTGNAPCVFEEHYKPSNILTLACCKGGQIRKYGNQEKPVRTGLRHCIGRDMEENPNDNYYVIGILKERVVYIAEVSKSILMTDYFSDNKNRNRMDCIYDVNKADSQWMLKRRKRFNPSFHGKEYADIHHHDELGEYVLVSNNFIYQGNDKQLLITESIKELIPKRQETKKYTNNLLIESFVDDCMKKGRTNNFEPTERLDENSCSTKGCQK